MRRDAISFAWLIFAACAACTAMTPHPPDLGNCSGIDASCPAPTIARGGGGPAADGGAAARGCVVSALDSRCAQCANASCCDPLAACDTDVACQNLSSCEQNCGGLSACVAACEGQSPTGIALLEALTTCVDSKCVVCTESGVGDPCNPLASACIAGLTCGLGCTKPCARSSDCAGLGAGGGNALNLPNACVASASSGEVCAPGCSVNADCASFPGTFCFATTSIDRLAIRICSPTIPAGPPDAGAD